MPATTDPLTAARPKTVRQGITLLRDQHDALDRISKRADTSKNALVRDAVQRLIIEWGEDGEGVGRVN